MATFILKNTTTTVPAEAGQLEFNTDKKTLVVSDGTDEIVIAKLNSQNNGAFYSNNAISTSGDLSANNAFFLGNVSISGNLFLGNNTSDNINALGVFTSDLKPGSPNAYDIGATDSVWKNVYATSISGAIAATNGVISGSSQIPSLLPSGIVSGSSQIDATATTNWATGIKTQLNTNTVVSGSAQVIALLPTGVISGSSQITEVAALNQYTASNNTKWSTLQGVTSSILNFTASEESKNSTLATYTGSNDTKWSTLQNVTASILNFTGSEESKNLTLATYTGSVNIRLNNLESTTASLNTSVSNLNTFSASENSKAATLATYTASVESRFSTLATLTGSISTEQTAQNNRLTKLEESSGSINDYTASLKTAIDVTGGNTTIKGNLIVAGTTTAVQSTTLNVADKNIVIASGSTTSPQADGAGITIDGAGVSMSWSDTNQKMELNKPLAIIGAISASTIDGLNGAPVLAYSTSVDSRLSNIQLFSSSVEGKWNTLATYTGSNNTKWTTLENVTASILNFTASQEGKDSTLATYTGSVNSRLSNLESKSASVDISISNLNTFSSSENSKAATLATYTSSLETRMSSLATVTGSLISSASAVSQSVWHLHQFSSSQLSKDATLATLTASYDGRWTTLATTTGSINTSLTNINSHTASTLSRLSALEIETSNLESTTASLNISVSNINIATASLNDWSASVRVNITNIHDFTSSVNGKFNTLQNVTSSLNTHTASALVSMSVIFGSASALDGRLDYLEGIAFGGIDISGQFTAIGNVTSSLILSASAASQSIWHLHQFSSSENGKSLTLASYTGSNDTKWTTLASYTGSNDTKWSTLGTQSGSWVTETESGSFLITASVSGQTLTFTKGDASTFNILIPTASYFTSSISVSGSVTISGSVNNVNYIDFNTASATPTWKSGRVFWDNTDGCLAVYNAEADVTLNVGQENWTRVFNDSGVVINNGQPVRIVGTHGDVPEVVLAQSIAVSGSVNLVNQVLGIATHTIEVGTFGYITTQGLVRGLNTNEFTDGDTLFLGTGSAGTLQKNAPVAPYEIIPIGQVVKASPGGSGIVYVAIQQPIDFSDLSSVLVEGTFDNGDMWQYVGSGVNGVWKHRTISEIGLVTTSSFNQYTSSGNISLDQLNQYTASNNTKWSTLGSLSGSFARTNSANTFNGNQIISGSLTVTQDFVVLGSSSIQNISSSTLNIGTNLITVAVNQPSIRFGGIAVIDSGSSGGSGSLLYDAVQDEFIFVHRGNGTNVTSSHFLLGPETIDNLGNETYLTNNRIPKGTGKEHLNDSNISDTGTLITLGSNSVVNGTFYATGATLVSGSSQIDATATTNWATGIKTQLNSNTVISGSSQVNGTQITNNSIQIAGTSVALGGNIALITITGGSGIISGSGQLGNYETTGRGIVSGSSQVTPLLPTGTVSGSSQLTSSYDGRYLLTGSVTSSISQLNTFTASVSTASLVTSITNLNTFSSSALTRLTALEVETANLESFTSSINTTIKTRLDVEGVISSSNQLTSTFDTRYLNTGGDGVFSSSVQIGNYVATITGTSNQVVVAGANNNAAAVTLSLPQSINTTSDVQFNNITASAGIRATGDIIAYFSSDERLKENVQPIQNALSKVELISGNTYDWKEGFDNIHPHKGNDVGVIAQEVEKVLPQVVINRDNGYKAVDYEKIVPLLIEAIKELSAKVKELESK
jgi:hypothetical protein